MNLHQLTISEKDEIHRDAILNFADKFGADYSEAIETKDGTIFEFEFLTYEHLRQFKDSLNLLRPKLF